MLYTVPVGSTHAFTATGTYSDGSTADITSQVTWTSDNTGVATIDSTGLATGVASGTANITATLSGVKSTPALLAVTAPTPVPTSTGISTTTTSASSRYQGTATGTWSGTVVYNNKTHDVGGDLTETIDENGNVTGSITGTRGAVGSATNSIHIDPNGNVTGTSSFVIGTTTFTFTWQGKVTVSGTTISLSGTWTGQYGSGVFSLSGNTAS